MRENTEYIRKRKPINFTVDDLNEDESEDENWKESPKVVYQLLWNFIVHPRIEYEMSHSTKCAVLNIDQPYVITI